MAAAKREILLVGSVPLGSAEQVFATCAEALDGRVKRLPDGETGPRTNWIAWQRAVVNSPSALRRRMPQVMLRAGFTRNSHKDMRQFCKGFRVLPHN